MSVVADIRLYASCGSLTNEHVIERTVSVVGVYVTNSINNQPQQRQHSTQLPPYIQILSHQAHIFHHAIRFLL